METEGFKRGEPVMQKPPKGDSRHRVNRSAKFYIGELRVGTGGGTWFFTESAERVVHRFQNRTKSVVYRNRFYSLRPPSEMEQIVREHLALGGGVAIAGRDHQPDDDPFEPHEFIDITSPETHAQFKLIIQQEGDRASPST